MIAWAICEQPSTVAPSLTCSVWRVSCHKAWFHYRAYWPDEDREWMCNICFMEESALQHACGLCGLCGGILVSCVKGPWVHFTWAVYTKKLYPLPTNKVQIQKELDETGTYRIKDVNLRNWSRISKDRWTQQWAKCEKPRYMYCITCRKCTNQICILCAPKFMNKKHDVICCDKSQAKVPERRTKTNTPQTETKGTQTELKASQIEEKAPQTEIIIEKLETKENAESEEDEFQYELRPGEFYTKGKIEDVKPEVKEIKKDVQNLD